MENGPKQSDFESKIPEVAYEKMDDNQVEIRRKILQIQTYWVIPYKNWMSIMLPRTFESGFKPQITVKILPIGFANSHAKLLFAKEALTILQFKTLSIFP